MDIYVTLTWTRKFLPIKLIFRQNMISNVFLHISPDISHYVEFAQTVNDNFNGNYAPGKTPAFNNK